MLKSEQAGVPARCSSAGMTAVGGGLYIRKLASGNRSWVYRDRFRGNDIWVTIGHCQDMTEQAAKEAAAELRAAGGTWEPPRISDIAAALTVARVADATGLAKNVDRLLPEHIIVSAAAELTPVVGVYFLVHAGQVVYVGKSVDIFSRVRQHKDKRFSSVAYITCRATQLDALEAAYINALTPKYNVNSPRVKQPGNPVYEPCSLTRKLRRRDLAYTRMAEGCTCGSAAPGGDHG